VGIIPREALPLFKSPFNPLSPERRVLEKLRFSYSFFPFPLTRGRG